jgi:hypothetical protein
MNTEEIYKLAEEMKEQQVENVLADWITRNEKESIRCYESLVRLGDSKQLACATVMLHKPFDKETLEAYRFAYEN